MGFVWRIDGFVLYSTVLMVAPGAQDLVGYTATAACNSGIAALHNSLYLSTYMWTTWLDFFGTERRVIKRPYNDSNISGGET